MTEQRPFSWCHFEAEIILWLAGIFEMNEQETQNNLIEVCKAPQRVLHVMSIDGYVKASY